MPIEFDGPNSKVSADTIAGQGGSTITIQSGHNLSGGGSGLTGLNATQLTSGTIPIARIANDAIDSQHYAAGSIDNEHLADDAVGVAELSATGTASSSTFLRGDNAWAAAGGGKVLQTIISDVHTARESTTSTTKAAVDANWAATITPSATSSKVLIHCNFESNLGNGSGTRSYHMTVYRNSTDIDPSAGSGWQHGLWMEYSISGGQWLFNSFTWLDSPNTTSAVVYKPYWWVESGGSWLLGGTNNTTDNASRIYLWEIGA